MVATESVEEGAQRLEVVGKGDGAVQRDGENVLAPSETEKKWEKVQDKNEINPNLLTFPWDTSAPACDPAESVQKSIYISPSPSSSKESDQSEGDQTTVLEPVRDVFTLEGVLTPEECEFLRRRTDEIGYSFWDESEGAQSDFRSAWTIEVTHQKLADAVWRRVRASVPSSIVIGDEESDPRWERELEGEWEAVGVNPVLLFARYRDGGHFGPHSDGCTVIDVNHRSLFPFLIYLNTPEEGGETAVLHNEQRDVPIPKDAEGRYTAEEKFVYARVRAQEGRGLVFFHTQMHEGVPVAKGSEKYIIRTDIMYRRKVPILAAPKDKEAYALWQEAQLMAEQGHAKEAAVLFRKCVKTSRDVADFLGL
uniref:Fe2OG dioxygenase domain-containing protein n=1 Tax=Chromera velia CCMP2878 TaxID=1169474 RepID=A0A0G4I068_9ALVE|mmetsp:Transcript_35433/g.69933  ORF Transcript_35433/g.69933 Transcript_35433/m.69933 type:complete len:365 (-) Transcript_35433:76-1170(-)|eukprot:Cvel_9875.t1-p1 / transcript=Cvel_9875.t1 / gene=Cvel_9875 / organism=Chromera_velia_CCMP2878 / gene_product=hypothetical protein / transcript_product=hypothetical protein / location=Cvel_scaffold582:49030-51373(-) / protein_length=364 / sequence_SO=supercontig / SO=protein_coding / is_pseudo=false